MPEPSELRREYERGCTIACLAMRYRVSQKKMHRLLREAGTRMRAPGIPRLVERIVELRNDDMTIRQISAELECSYDHVSRVLVSQGMRVRRVIVERVVALWQQGVTPTEIAVRVGRHRDTVYRVLGKHVGTKGIAE